MIALIIATLPLLLDESAAAARLAELRSGFIGRPKAQSMAALATLADEAPGTGAAARGLDWLGDLRRGDGDLPGARAAYARGYASRDPEGHRLGARGLGDLEMESGHFARGETLYREARDGAGGVLALELDQKIANAKKQHRRAMVEWAAWAFIAGTLAFFVARSRLWQRPRLGAPTEALYVVPVYALLIAGCWRRYSAVLHALWLLALWSLSLIAAAGLAARRRPPLGRGHLVHATLLVAANVALFYAVVNRAGVLDSLFMTVAQ